MQTPQEYINFNKQKQQSQYDSSLQSFYYVYEPSFSQIPENEIKQGNYLIRIYKNRLSGVQCVVKKLIFKSQIEWKQRFEDELAVFDQAQQHQRYYYLKLMDYFIGKENNDFVIYIVQELSRTLKGYLDYILDKFSGFNKKFLNRPEMCNGCSKKKQKIVSLEKRIEFLEKTLNDYQLLQESSNAQKKEIKELKKQVNDQQLVIDMLEGNKRQKEQQSLDQKLKDKTTIKGINIQTINDHKRQITDMIDIDDQLIATCEEKQIKIFNVIDPNNYKCIKTISKEGEMYNCLMLYDAKTLLIGLTNKKILIYEKLQYSGILEGNTAQVTGLYLSDNKGEFFSTSLDGKIIQWDFLKRQIKNIFNEHTKDLSNNSIIFVQNSKNLISVSSDKTIKLWDVKKPQKSLHSLEINNAAFSIQNFDSTHFITGHFKEIRVWKYINKVFKDNFFEQILKTECHQDVVFDIQVLWVKNQIGQIISGSTDTSVKIWELNLKTQEMQCLNILTGHRETVTNVLLRGKYVFSCSVDGTIKIWE